MRFYFYRGPEPNFGDELNEYLLPRLLPGFFDDHEDPLFLGVGSIIYDHHPQQVRKLVFGAGYGGYTRPPKLDASWTVYSVRGPRTAAALGLDPRLANADLAVALPLVRPASRKSRYRASFMPHYESLRRGDWALVAEEAGLHFIDPRWPVEVVLTNLEESDLVVAEAMHGAIVADALRVPWVPLLPLDERNRFKWHDWAEALDVRLAPQRLRPSSFFELADNFRVAGRGVRRMVAPYRESLKKVAAGSFRSLAARSLRKAAEAEGTLSPDAAVARALDRFQSDLTRLRRDFPT
jgi:succinoglycan biosynthesis protein ExoV